ncbi:ABC transporter permease [Dinghuibacter silviterrae]|uniref:Putative ABC transport system permease protein n=1 Tax=Dinghuibacter silviterrae TaxID=1539049 RepID=A0A4R8DE75_9BACT|nr:ABC transporter permease [Dinghuibacter silviterrae]TDW95811.1 putative ABC transport system permease protein [Dinghuibacter silviterrae]
MIKNLLLVAIRNLKRDKWYSLLNILGLTIGITFGLLLLLYIKDELSYDRYHEKANRIVRIVSNIKEESKDTMRWSSNPYPLGPTLKKDFPEVEEAIRFVDNGTMMFKTGDTRFYNENTFFVDSGFFRVFTYPLLEGDPNTALVDPKSLVLTRSIAEKYFGKVNGIVGRTLLDDSGAVYKITGVMEDVPKNSQLTFNILISNATLPVDFSPQWGNFSYFTYVLLRPHTDLQAFDRKMLPLYDKFMAPIFAKNNIKIRLSAQPLTEMHLHSTDISGPGEYGSMSYIFIFGAVALFMVLIACINYMNLTTARSARRAKEIGIRKVTGSSRSQLITQFLVESTLSSLVALVLSLVLIALLLPTFNTLAGKFITLNTLLDPSTSLLLLGIVLFVGLCGGSYPAFYLSKFMPVNILKGALSKGSSNVTLRRILIVTQFSISMTMLICTFVVYNQLQYLQHKDMGFNKDEVANITVNSNSDERSRILAFKNEMRNTQGVHSVSTAESIPGFGNSFQLFDVQTDHGIVDKGVDVYGIDEDYFKTLGIQLTRGRNFSGLPDTLHSIVVNENMVRYFGWKNPIGMRVKYPGDTTGRHYLEVVGVFKDFNWKSLYSPMSPLILLYRPNSFNVQLKLDAQNIPATLAIVEKNWKTAFPELPFSYIFLDREFDSQYAADQRRGKIFTAFSILTVVITCLGLLGLIAFTTEQRQKEISIRKILGAGLTEIIPLITRNFVYLVGLSCFIAFPVAYWFMHHWLDNFSYNTGMTFGPFILSALAVLVLTLLTVIFHTVKAAVANPSKSLRTE